MTKASTHGSIKTVKEDKKERYKTTTVRDLKKGDWFTKKEINEPKESQVWVRGEYDRESKKYICYRWDDINREW